jgi:hypothetical protein
VLAQIGSGAEAGPPGDGVDVQVRCLEQLAGPVDALPV